MFTPSYRPRRRASARLRYRKPLFTTIIALAVLVPVFTALAAISLSTTTPYVQTFDGIGTSATAPMPTDFKVDKQTTVRTVGTYAAAGTATERVDGSNVSTTAANGIYNFGSGSTDTGSDRSVGFLSSGTGTQSGNIYAQFVNNTGGSLTGLTISYDVEKYRNGSNAAGFRYQMYYSTDGTSWTDAGANFLTSFPADANNNGCATAPCATASVTNQTLNVSIPNGGNIYLAWNFSVASGTTVTNSQALAIDNISVLGVGGGPAQSSLTINDVAQAEGNSGQTAFTFTVTLNPADPSQTVTVNYATANGTTNPATGGATCGAGVDYITTSGTLTFVPNDTSETVTVQVCGDTDSESNETFFVNLSGATNATIGDAQGLGTIQNDDIALLLISQVQGSTPSGNAPSPYAGQTVSVQGIVTLLKSNGFFLQEEVSDSDGNTNTSEGVFVFTSAAPTTAVGNLVTVTGTVVEFNGLTEISTTNPNVVTNNTGNSPPTAVTITAADLPATGPNAHYTQPLLEKYEGMRLTAPSLTTVAPNNQFFEVYTVITGQPRPLREPGIEADKPVPPDPTSGTPDPNVPRFDLNPERLLVDTNDRAGSTGEVFTSNVVITNLAGPLDYAFGSYRVVAEAAPTRSANMSAVPLRLPGASEFTIAGYNIENFNNNATQRVKAAMTICDVIRTPDIIGVVEIFDLADLQALATEVQSRCGVAYSSHLIEANGTDGDNDQDVGYLIKTSRVAIDSITQELKDETFIPPGSSTPAVLHDRPPLVLRGRVDPSGANLPVITVVNHTRSFICIDADVDPTVAAGCTNGAADGPRVREKRKKQAESLAALFQNLQTNNPGTSVIAVGDYNAFQFNNGYDDPISVMKGNPTPDDQIVVDQSPDLVNPDFYNLIDDLPFSEQYSFNFENTLQALDHHLVNTVARARNTGIAIGRVNSDYPESPASAFASNNTRPERNSDHDPVVSYYTLAPPAASGQLLISEFRLRGPGGATDEFVEIYNNTSTQHTVLTSDGSAGYAVADSTGAVRCTIPAGTKIPARGHFLCANSSGYSLASYPAGTNGATATADANITADIADNVGIALFNTANTSNFSLTSRLDAVGSTSEANTLYRENNGYPALSPLGLDYSFYRRPPGGCTGSTPGNGNCTTLLAVQNTPGPVSSYPQDTGDNAADFLFVDTSGTNAGAGQRLGAPGPENLSSPVHNDARALAAPNTFSCAGATASPNRVRDTGATGSATYGTLEIRKTFINLTGAPINRLRFRVIDITTLPSNNFGNPVASCNGSTCVADVRVLTSSDTTVPNPCHSNAPTLLRGTTLEQPPTQTLGGGYNSSLSADTITLAQPLAHGASVNVRWLLGVEQNGKFRFFVTVEALP